MEGEREEEEEMEGQREEGEKRRDRAKWERN